MTSRIRTLFYIFFLHPDYVAARLLRSLCSNKGGTQENAQNAAPEKKPYSFFPPYQHPRYFDLNSLVHRGQAPFGP